MHLVAKNAWFDYNVSGAGKLPGSFPVFTNSSLAVNTWKTIVFF